MLSARLAVIRAAAWLGAVVAQARMAPCVPRLVDARPAGIAAPLTVCDLAAVVAATFGDARPPDLMGLRHHIGPLYGADTTRSASAALISAARYMPMRGDRGNGGV